VVPAVTLEACAAPPAAVSAVPVVWCSPAPGSSLVCAVLSYTGNLNLDPRGAARLEPAVRGEQLA